MPILNSNKRVSILAVLLIFSLPGLWSQEKPNFMPEDIESNYMELECLCKPGVINKSRSRGIDIHYIQILGDSFEEEKPYYFSDDPSSLKRTQALTLKIKAPLINKEGMKFLLGAFYSSENFTFDEIRQDFQNPFQHIDGIRLKHSGIEALFTKSLNDRHYTNFRIRYMANGDYKGVLDFSDKYRILNASGVFAFKKNDNMEWGIGINYAKSFRRTLLVPFIIYNKTFNERWGLEAVLPTMVVGRYNFSPRSILLFGIQYNSRSYSIDVPETFGPVNYAMNHSELRLGVGVEKHIQDWLWINLAGGFQENFSTDFEALDASDFSFKVEPKSSPFIKLGIFLSPPDSFFK
ncbi:MAG: hypothetical protein HKN16_08740 [Saprospiraceae bacterium]|nr:hypothetical protein [Saprospiraceae bacterium]